MNKRAFLLAIIGSLLGTLSTVHAEPKAYEVVKYRGKAGGATIVFEYGDGYVDASAIKITTAGKTSEFHLDYNATGNAKFIPLKPGGKITSVTLKVDINDTIPDTVKGSYVTGDKTVSFTVKKSE